jgi:hypothetical protein
MAWCHYFSLDYQQSVISFCSLNILSRTYTNIKVCCWWKQSKADTSNTITCTACLDRVPPRAEEYIGQSWWSIHWLQNCTFLLASWISTVWPTSHVQTGVAERVTARLTVASQQELCGFTDTANNQITNYNPPTQNRPFILLHTVQQSCSPIYLWPFSTTIQYVAQQVKIHKTANNHTL